MLLKSKPQMIARRMTIHLPGEAWARLDALEKRAGAAGMSLQIEAALAHFLSRQISHAERELATAARHSSGTAEAAGED